MKQAGINKRALTPFFDSFFSESRPDPKVSYEYVV